MPNSYSHTIYKEYVEMLKSEEKQKNAAAEEISDELEEQMQP